VLLLFSVIGMKAAAPSW